MTSESPGQIENRTLYNTIYSSGLQSFQELKTDSKVVIDKVEVSLIIKFDYFWNMVEKVWNSGLENCKRITIKQQSQFK